MLHLYLFCFGCAPPTIPSTLHLFLCHFYFQFCTRFNTKTLISLAGLLSWQQSYWKVMVLTHPFSLKRWHFLKLQMQAHIFCRRCRIKLYLRKMDWLHAFQHYCVLSRRIDHQPSDEVYFTQGSRLHPNEVSYRPYSLSVHYPLITK